MNCLVTGGAGFIGSHLCDELLRQGHIVSGVDAFVPYYPAAIKEQNLSGARQHPAFTFIRADLRTDNLDPLVAAADVIFHLAAMPGLSASWTQFEGYLSCNVLATQRLLEAIQRVGRPSLRLIYGSTSSVYGKFATGDETLPTRPISPYGVTKLAGEHLCRAYAATHGIDLVTLRYFSVYGPRQRPEMAYHLFIRAFLSGAPISVFGDGHQVRSNTYVGDCVSATMAVLRAPRGETYNVGGGEAASVWDILGLLESITGKKVTVERKPARAGDQQHTTADTGKILHHLGWKPTVSLREGLTRQWEWQTQMDAIHTQWGR